MPIYGGFWIRVAAYFIDAILLGVVGGILGAILGVGMGAAMAGNSNAAEAAGFAGNGVGLVLGWLYNALMESSANRGTVGKMALGLVVTDEQGGQLSFGRATGRYFAKILSALIMLIGFMMVGWTERKQGLHDMIAGTLVTKKGTLGDRFEDVFQ